MDIKGKVMYLGKWINQDNQVRFKYIVINKDNTLGKEWNFKKSIFTKGTIGSIFDCEFEDDSIVYRKSTIPSSYLEREGKLVSTYILFPELRRYEEENRQVEVRMRNSKKATSPLEEEIKFMKQTYRSLPTGKRSAFIANLIYKIAG